MHDSNPQQSTELSASCGLLQSMARQQYKGCGDNKSAVAVASPPPGAAKGVGGERNATAGGDEMHGPGTTSGSTDLRAFPDLRSPPSSSPAQSRIAFRSNLHLPSSPLSCFSFLGSSPYCTPSPISARPPEPRVLASFPSCSAQSAENLVHILAGNQSLFHLVRVGAVPDLDPYTWTLHRKSEGELWSYLYSADELHD